MPKPSEPDRLPSFSLEDWLKTNALAQHRRPDRACLHRMAGLSPVGRLSSHLGCEGEDCHLSGAIFDHARRFKIRGSNRISDFAGVISAPYLYEHEMVEDAERIAEEYGLAFRIGDPRDDWYGYGTTPIVIWNPDRVSL